MPLSKVRVTTFSKYVVLTSFFFFAEGDHLHGSAHNGAEGVPEAGMHGVVNAARRFQR